MRRLRIHVFATVILCLAWHGHAMAQRQADNEHDHLDPVYAGSLPPPPEARQSLYDRYDEGQKGLDAEDDPHRLASPTSRSVSLSFAPGAVIPIVRLAQDYPASITFLDATGQPWPISWDITTNKNGSCDEKGQGKNASVRAVGINACVPEPGSNVLQLTPTSRYPHGGLLVSLKDAPKPLSFIIFSGTGSYDADLTVRINKRGPNAKDMPNAGPDAPETAEPVLSSILDGVPPADAVPLVVSGVSADKLRAWKLGQTLYLRTSLQLISPAPQGQVREFDVTAYAAPATTRALVSAGDRMIPISLQEDAP